MSMFSPFPNCWIKWSILALCIRWCSCHPFQGWWGCCKKDQVSQLDIIPNSDGWLYDQTPGRFCLTSLPALWKSTSQEGCHLHGCNASSSPVVEVEVHPLLCGWVHACDVARTSSMMRASDAEPWKWWVIKKIKRYILSRLPWWQHPSKTRPYQIALGT